MTLSVPEPQGIQADILRAVRERPGIPMSELRRALAIGWGTLYDHLRALEDVGDVRRVRSGRRQLLVPREQAYTDDELASLGGLHGASARRVAEAVAAQPRATAQTIASKLGMNARVTYYHLARLDAAGLVRLVERSRPSRYEPTARLVLLLQRSMAGADGLAHGRDGR